MVDTVNISDDTFVSSSASTTNWGTDQSILCRNDSAEYIGLLDWDISSITLANVVDVKLNIRGYSYPTGEDGNVTLRRVTSSWSEASVTYNTRPTINNSDLDTIVFDTDTEKWYTFDMLQLIGHINDGTYTQYGVALERSSGLGMAGFRSSDSIYDPYLTITYHSDSCYYYDTNSPYIYNTIVWCVTGTARVDQGETEQVGDYTTSLAIKTPWGSTYESSEFLEVGETATYSRSITDGTEYFKVKYVTTLYNGEVGYYPYYYVEWYREYNKRYVKTSGDDDDNGFGWNCAYESIEKGMDNIPNNGKLYVESGIYIETLGNINLASGNTKAEIHPTNRDHVDTNWANIVIGTGTITTQNSYTSGTYSQLQNSSYYLHRCSMDNTLVFGTGVLQLVDVVLRRNTDINIEVQLVHIRPSGSEYLYIEDSDWYPVTIDSSTPTTHKDLYCGFTMVSGDKVAIKTRYVSGGDGGTVQYQHTNSDAGKVYKLIDNDELTGDSPITDWSDRLYIPGASYHYLG